MQVELSRDKLTYPTVFELQLDVKREGVIGVYDTDLLYGLANALEGCAQELRREADKQELLIAEGRTVAVTQNSQTAA